ncbi:MAG: hypothetical protein KDC69_08080 [Flavobacteriaceae bacterium]|nr:hypothetical protein [Flavobacteriaceae bacterium]
MKKIRNFILFLSAILILLTLFNKFTLSYHDPFKVNKDCNVLILGDSHAKFAFNDQIIKRTCNFSNDADSYFYSYLKLKQILKINPQIDTVLISFGSQNIHKSVEDKWLLNNDHMNDRMTIYFPLLDLEDYAFLIQEKPVEFLIGAFTQTLFSIRLYTNDEKRFGGYEDLRHDILSRELKNPDLDEREEYGPYKEANFERKYLQKMIDLCHSKGIGAILVNPPVDKIVRNRQGNLYKFYNKYFSNILFYDLSRIDMKDSYFGDLVHLKASGATYLSELINKENLLNPKYAEKYGIIYKGK